MWRKVKSEIKPVFALAGITLKEAVRSKLFFFVLIVALLAILGVSSLEAVGLENTLKLMREWVVLIIVGTCIFLSIFLAAFSIPFEIESKRIQTVLSKPVSRGAYFISKVLGFILVICVIFVILGASGALMLSIVSSKLEKSAAIDTNNRLSFKPANITIFGDTSYVRSTGTKADPGLVLTDPHKSGVSLNFKIDNFDDFFADNCAYLDFTASLRVKAYRQLNAKSFLISAKPPGMLEPIFERTLDFKDPMRYRLKLPREIFSKTGETVITFEFTEYPYAVLITPESVRITGIAVPFLSAVAKTLISQLGKIIFIISIVCLFSALFSPYTSVLVGLAMWFLCNQVEKIPQAISFLQRQIEFDTARKAKSWLDVVSNAFMQSGLNDLLLGLTKLIPDFKRFDIFWNFIAGYDSSFAASLGALGYYSMWSIGAVFLGYILFSFIDFS